MRGVEFARAQTERRRVGAHPRQQGRVALTLLFGLLAAVYTVPALAPVLQRLGLDLRQLRPLHDTFASIWIFLAGAAVVQHFLARRAGPMTAGDRWRLRIQLVVWAAAGLGILITLSDC